MTTLNVTARVVAVGAISSMRPRHWTVAAISPTSLTCMTKYIAPRAIA
jgi:hypothetical protein